MILSGPILSQLVPKDLKYSEMVRICPKWSEMVRNGLQWSQMVQLFSKGPKRFKLSKWFQLALMSIMTRIWVLLNFRRLKEDVRIGLLAGWRKGVGGGEMLHET